MEKKDKVGSEFTEETAKKAYTSPKVEVHNTLDKAGECGAWATSYSSTYGSYWW